MPDQTQVPDESRQLHRRQPRQPPASHADRRRPHESQADGRHLAARDREPRERPRSITPRSSMPAPPSICPPCSPSAQKHGVKFLKAMQCNNIAQPLGQGLWEGVPLRNVLRTTGKMRDVRRVYYWGFHNNDPKQMFQSSLAINQVLDTPPGELPPFIAYRLNGQPIPLERGGPVRMLIPWAHGFKSVKWLQHITLTNDYKANDTYALQNNDPESYLKTAAYIDDPEPGSYQRRADRSRSRERPWSAGPVSNESNTGSGPRPALTAASTTTIPPGRRPSGAPAQSIRRRRIGAAAFPKTSSPARSGASAPTANPRNGRCVSASHSGRSASRT